MSKKNRMILPILILLLTVAGCGEPVPAVEAERAGELQDGLSAERMNRWFAQLGRDVGVTVPHTFQAGESYSQRKLDENFQAIHEALYE